MKHFKLNDSAAAYVCGQDLTEAGTPSAAETTCGHCIGSEEWNTEANEIGLRVTARQMHEALKAQTGKSQRDVSHVVTEISEELGYGRAFGWNYRAAEAILQMAESTLSR